MGISRLTAFCGIHGGQFLTLRIKSALALSVGERGGDAGWRLFRGVSAKGLVFKENPVESIL